MNKIFWLKMLIAFITFLIFLTLGGIVYALVNYKTTPKLLSRKKPPAVVETVKPDTDTGTQAPAEMNLKLGKDERLKSSHACGDMLCLHIKSDLGRDRIIILDPAALRIKAVLNTK